MRLGRHMPTNAKPVKAAETARWLGCNAIQIFASNPTGWRPAADAPTACAAFAHAARELDLNPVVIHAPYLINLASPEDEIWGKSISLLRWTLQRGALLGACVVAPILVKRALGNRPPVRPGWRTRVQRVLFDRDEPC